MKLPDKLYGILKWLALIAFDAVGVFYQGLANIWNLPYGAQVSSTFALISVLVGTLIGVSTYNYNKDKINEDNK